MVPKFTGTKCSPFRAGARKTKRFVDVRQGVVGQPLSPPVLPTSVPSQKKYHVDEAVWASKVAWLMETKRANVTGDAISGVRLNQLYQQGRRSYLKHAADLEVRAKNRPAV